MAVIALASASGSPGVTTTALGMALLWARPALLVEADPTGGSALLAGYWRGQRDQAGLLELVMAERHGVLADALPRMVLTVDGTDVSVVLDLMIHDIDLILDFVNSPLSAVRANGAGILTPTLDIANARLEFACGTVANVTSSRVSLKQERRLRFFQKDTYISLDLIAKRGSVVQRSEAAENLLRQMLRSDEAVKPEELVETQSLEPAPEDKDALALELEAWVDAVLSNTKPVVDGQAGLRAMRAAARITDAINQKPNTKYG